MRQILKSSQLFSQLDESALGEICSAATLRRAGANEIIFQEGEPANAFFIVGTGKVKVFKLSPDGKEQILMIAQAGDSFAEAALFSDRRFPASSQAMEPTELVAIDRVRFIGLLGRNPDLAVSLIGRLSELLRKMTDLVEELSLANVNTRLAHFLYSYADATTGDIPEIIVLKEKKSVLASQLGTIPETLSRAFAKLVKDGIITVDGPNVKIVDFNALESLAQSGK